MSGGAGRVDGDFKMIRAAEQCAGFAGGRLGIGGHHAADAMRAGRDRAANGCPDLCSDYPSMLSVTAATASAAIVARARLWLVSSYAPKPA